MKYIYVVAATLIIMLIGYTKYISNELDNEEVKVRGLKDVVVAKTIENNLTSIASEAIGKLKQIKEDAKNEKTLPTTVGTHTHIFK